MILDGSLIERAEAETAALAVNVLAMVNLKQNPMCRFAEDVIPKSFHNSLLADEYDTRTVGNIDSLQLRTML